MRISVRRYVVVAALTLVLSGCTPGRSLIGAGSGLEDLHALQTTLDQTAGSAPSTEQYQAARQRFVGTMTDILAQQARQARSPARKIKNVITLAGVVLGLGGTVASLVVKDEDTRSAIAQASGGVAGVAGIVSLIPFGSASRGAAAVGAYLSAEMPLFEARWPETPDGPLTPDEWGRFVGDVKHVTGLVEELGR